MKIVVKIGGAALDDPDLRGNCAAAIAQLAREHQVAIVHGGGASLSRTLQRMGKKSEFVDGLRVTDAETRDVALMVLGGQVNKQVVAEMTHVGCPAVGLCGADGGILVARKKITPRDLGFVGEICSSDWRILDALWAHQCVPVLASLALGADGEYYNINADHMASSCAVACKAHALVFLTDVAGVRDATGSVIPQLLTSAIADLIRELVVAGGMLPKLQACREALAQGVGRVRILPAFAARSLPQLCSGNIAIGTEVVA